MTSGLIGTLILDGEDITTGTLMDLETGDGIAGTRTIVTFIYGIDRL